uniref:Arf-GAP domain-containing protein n=1 Tax=Odontella aurita TaxID=265563 RepID=A0A7S4JPG9_9STRA|mmetsp:Transcript_51199/g.153805  ORF Transcript_51199/g.153805 Transcript_51199/m.153805 type:complete len:486 (+) Transcript_51199:85-1542(+)|eukprot:CAMPEP_0113534988 /NCGR_PEP_ID=MMETSP0015_2-20120614/5451_1 /TAXON_ID=2838 /ORGANISM="Odontella" /LENGTH=485 /DNA_ID=CAMNT_0000434183 /DNA_START=43 /DNA_END=1500 /DNA_ORIENTATION=+ /assembly_acc=CAM_ASM_000160
MVQMTPADQKVVKVIPGNSQCAECGMKNPQWASVSFGTVFCLECSGVHRSLGVHISFVRSIAMDSWTPQQLALMKAGGNQKCKTYLSSKGVSPSTPIKEKYESPAAQLYKEVLKARVEGRPEPTEIPKPAARKPARAPSSGGMSGGGVASKGSNDPNGMERLAGETEAQYVARQTRLRNEAKARMAAKFGGGGGMGGMVSGGGSRMGGVGSDPNYRPGGGYGGGGVDVNAVTGSLVSGFGAAFSTLGAVASTAASQASAVYHDENTHRSVANLTSSVTSTGTGLWGSLTSSVSQVATTLTQPDANDGLSDLQRMSSSQKTGKYSGFGSGSAQAGGFGAGGGGSMSHASSASSMGVSSGGGAVTPTPGEDPNGLAKLMGETDEQYVARQTRIREEAKARMAAKFGTGKPNMSSAGSSGYGGGGGGGATAPLSSSSSMSAPNSMNAPSTMTPTNPFMSAPSSGNAPKLSATKLKVSDSEDFFSSFGA